MTFDRHFQQGLGPLRIFCSMKCSFTWVVAIVASTVVGVVLLAGAGARVDVEVEVYVEVDPRLLVVVAGLVGVGAVGTRVGAVLAGVVVGVRMGVHRAGGGQALLRLDAS